ncbi:MAG: DUF1906 domain-containing protein [Actinobacteria bacterium]|nr:DUF1906 domain-containing protein [Actinomycetota bacterium]
MTSGPGKRLPARLLFGGLVLLVALAAAVGSASAAGTGARTVHFAGRAVHVPAGFGVVRVAPGSHTCVRLDRRVVYLGAPSKEQRCPAGPLLGRRQAIVVTPHHQRAAARSRVQRRATARASVAPATGSAAGSVFTGLGFDTCSAPSTKALAAWAESPFRGVGIYIGGENSACSQPNLTAAWVSAETAAGWHLIPTYVGLQATTSSCSSCAKMSTLTAATQGTAAAEDAVSHAAAIGIGPGSPIYFDMESYTRTTSATKAVLTFLAAWTEKLHQLGYQSGVYSSSGSGIADLAAQIGTGAVLPDDIWIANWNNLENTEDAVVPAGAWANHQRIHQFRGGHNETWGGATINIDSNYIDGATVGNGTPAVGVDDPIGSLELTGSPAAGQVRVKGWALDPSAPTEALSIKVLVGGREGQEGVETYELGAIANLSRPDVAASHIVAGPAHGFDTNIVTLKSGRQPVCVYALNVALGGDRLLGCKTTTIPVAVTFSRLKAMRNGVKVTLACQWPVGTACPGHLGLRTSIRVTTPRRHRSPLVRTVTRSLGSRTFLLTGGQWHTFYVPLTTGARQLLRERGKLRAQVIAAIPGGSRGAGLPLESSAPRG